MQEPDSLQLLLFNLFHTSLNKTNEHHHPSKRKIQDFGAPASIYIVFTLSMISITAALSGSPVNLINAATVAENVLAAQETFCLFIFLLGPISYRVSRTNYYLDKIIGLIADS